MDKNRAPLQSRMFQFTVLDGKDEIEEKYESCYQALVLNIQGKGDKEISDSLNMEASKNHEIGVDSYRT